MKQNSVRTRPSRTHLWGQALFPMSLLTAFVYILTLFQIQLFVVLSMNFETATTEFWGVVVSGDLTL